MLCVNFLNEHPSVRASQTTSTDLQQQWLFKGQACKSWASCFVPYKNPISFISVLAEVWGRELRANTFSQRHPCLCLFCTVLFLWGFVLHRNGMHRNGSIPPLPLTAQWIVYVCGLSNRSAHYSSRTGGPDCFSYLLLNL